MAYRAGVSEGRPEPPGYVPPEPRQDGGAFVDRLRRAIYDVSVLHDWANTVDTVDRTEEIVAALGGNRAAFQAEAGAPQETPGLRAIEGDPDDEHECPACGVVHHAIDATLGAALSGEPRALDSLTKFQMAEWPEQDFVLYEDVVAALRLTGADIEAAIGRASPLVNPRLSEVDWDAVAAALSGSPQEPAPAHVHDARETLDHLIGIVDDVVEGQAFDEEIAAYRLDATDEVNRALNWNEWRLHVLVDALGYVRARVAEVGETPPGPDPVLESAYRMALGQIKADAEVIENLKVALRVATHSPHDQDGEPIEGFPVCSVCGAIQTGETPPGPLDALAAFSGSPPGLVLDPDQDFDESGDDFLGLRWVPKRPSEASIEEIAAGIAELGTGGTPAFIRGYNRGYDDAFEHVRETPPRSEEYDQ